MRARRAGNANGARALAGGVYASGDERLLVVATDWRHSLVRHVKLAPPRSGYCDERARLERDATGDYEVVGSSVPYLRSRGSSFVLLPRALGRCASHRAPIDLKRAASLLRCTVVGDSARPTSVEAFPTRPLPRGRRVDVAPWHADLSQVLVRDGARLGILAATEVDCAEAALRTLRDTLFGESRRRVPNIAAR